MREKQQGVCDLCEQMNIASDRVACQTRPDKRQDSRGRLGRGRNPKNARNSEIFGTYRPTHLTTNRPTQQGVEFRVRD